MNQPMRPEAAHRSARRHVPELALDWVLDAPARRWQVLDGTLCFADISGFTALAERLAQRGRIGGEELISRLGGVFADMLELVRERGGTLLKFGGDALLLFFDGPDHPRQAAAAAVAMRQVLRQAAATPTSVGPLRLSMSVGLHSGPAHFFLVGGRHRELVLLGPAANAVIATEQAANAGEIALSRATLARLPGDCSRPRADGLPLLRWRKPAVTPCGPRAERPISAAHLRQLLPGVLYDLLGSGVPEPEHRVACIGFIRFSGTDALLARDGPDTLAQALDETLAQAQECLDAERITLLAVDVDTDGGKLFLGSGVPYAHTDDEGNMLRALRRIADLGLPLTLQMGAHRGHVFAAEIGSPRRAAYSAMGDTTNTAARLAARAPAGQIYVHPAVLDQSLAVFESAPSPPLHMKGKKAPLVAYRIGVQTGTRRREGLEVAEFIGRDAELAALAAALAGLEQERGGVVCLIGETGMGKSRLIREALARAGRSPLLSLRGEPNTASSAYALFRDPLLRRFGLDALDAGLRPDALRAYIQRVDAELLPLAPLIGDVVGVTLGNTPQTALIEPQFRPVRSAHALLQLLGRAHPGPQTWVVDDGQWCDESSMVVLQALAQSCASHPWVLITARRPQGGVGTRARYEYEQVGTLLTLPGLDRSVLERILLSATEAAPLRPHELDVLVSRAGGNPLFALELLRAAREAGSFDTVPESLEAAMAAQVDALDPDARRLLRYASVLGRSFSREVLAEALRTEGQAPDDATLQRLAEFIEPEGDGRLRFRSDVICDTTYQAVSYQLRRRLHRHIGATLERLAPDAEAVAETLALHYARADDHARAWHYARRAGHRAAERYANAEAARFYTLALEAAGQQSSVAVEEQIDVLNRLGSVNERAGLLEASLDAYRRALRIAHGDPVSQADLLWSRACAKERMRLFVGALRDLRRALRLLEGVEGARAQQLGAQIRTTIALVLYGQGRPAKALAAARAAVGHARRCGDERALGGALVIVDLAAQMLQGAGDGIHLREALDIFERLGDLRMQAGVEANLGLVCAVGSRWEEATRWLNLARAHFLRLGDVVHSAEPGLNLGEILVNQRRFDEAEQVLKDSLRTLSSTHFSEGVNYAELQLGRVLLEQGAFDQVESMLARVQDEFAAAGQHLAALQAAAVRGLARCRAGAPRVALEIIDVARRAAGADAELLIPNVAPCRGEVLAELGEVDAALDELRAGIEMAQAQAMAFEAAVMVLLKTDIERRAGRTPDRTAAEAAALTLQRLGVRR